MPTIDNWRSTLMQAAINCPHGIVESEVLLHKSGKQSDGNALAQLADRLAEAVKPLLDERDRLAAEVDALRVALRFYATGEHFHLDPDEDWDSVSGEPENWLCSDREGSTTMFENGTVARMTLQGEVIDWTADGEDCTPSIVPHEAPAAAMKGKP